ncbi:alcohol dehydrogenase, partial [Trichodelitschia bisporula]
VQYGKPYEVHRVPTPRTLADHDILIKVAVASYCHSDTVAASGVFTTKLPIIASHEGTGTVVAVGPAVTNFKPGDRTIAALQRDRCGRCGECTSPHDVAQFCRGAKGSIGITIDGAFAEYLIGDSRTAVHVPDAVSFQLAAPLSCAGITIFRGVLQTGLKSGQWLAIVGSGGGLGHIGVQFAKASGLKVVGIEAREEALALSKEVGADLVLDAREGDAALVQKIAEATGYGGVDASINVSNAKSAVTTACAVVRTHGTMVQIAVEPPVLEIPARELWGRDLRLRGSLVCSVNEANQMMELVAKGGINVKSNVFHGLEEIPKLVHLVHSGKMQGKAIVVVDESQV